jgi:hypothetical protein
MHFGIARLVGILGRRRCIDDPRLHEDCVDDLRQVIAPRNDMRSGYRPEFLRPGDAGESHKILNRVLVCAGYSCGWCAPGAAVGNICEPLDLRRHVGQALKLGGGQQSLGRGNLGWELGVGQRVGHGALYS